MDAASDRYPSALRGLPEDYAPTSLWMRGNVPVSPPDAPAVAVVGARRASPQALVAARGIAAGLAGAGRVVVSGGAAGVDGAAHRGALDGGGLTVVVLGTGIDVDYPPQHRPLFAEVVGSGGAVISQFAPGVGPSQWSFPKRNRVIAGLASVVVVVEAQAGSGALYTSAAARALGRPVVVMTGSVGCDRLADSGIPRGATADEVLALILGHAAPAPHLRPTPPTPPVPGDPRALLLFEALDETPRDLSDLAVRAGLPAQEVMALAIDLELGGHAARAAGGRYLRLI